MERLPRQGCRRFEHSMVMVPRICNHVQIYSGRDGGDDDETSMEGDPFGLGMRVGL